MDQRENGKSVINKKEPMIVTREPLLEESTVSKTSETSSKTTETTSKILADLMTDAEKKTKNAATLGTKIANHANDIAKDAEEREHKYVDQVNSVLKKENILEYREREKSNDDTNSLLLLTCIEDNAFEAKRAAIAAEAAIEALKHSEKATLFVKTVAAFKPEGDSLIVLAAQIACTKAKKASEAIAEYKIAVTKSDATIIEAAKRSYNLFTNDHSQGTRNLPVKFQLNSAAKDLQDVEAAAKSAEEATARVKMTVEFIRQKRKLHINRKELENLDKKQEKEAAKRKQDIKLNCIMMWPGFMFFAPLTARDFLIPAKEEATAPLVPAVQESSTKKKPEIQELLVEVEKTEKLVLTDLIEKSHEAEIRAAVESARQEGTERTETSIEAAIRAAVDTILKRAAGYEEKANYVVKQVEAATAAAADAVKAEAAVDAAVTAATKAAETATAAAEEAKKAAMVAEIAKMAREAGHANMAK